MVVKEEERDSWGRGCSVMGDRKGRRGGRESSGRGEEDEEEEGE